MRRADEPRLPLAEFAKRVAVGSGIALAVAGLAFFFWVVSHALLVLFAAILLAVLLDGLTRLVVWAIHLPRGLALLLVILAVTAGVAGIFVLGGTRISSQAPQLRRSMQQSVQRIEHKLDAMGVSANTLGLGFASGGGGPDLSKIFSRVHGYLATSLAMATDLLIIIIAGIYFAISPGFYLATPVKLAPQHRRERLREVARVIGHALRRWLVGRFAAMASVGVITGIGLMLLDVRLAALLGIIAGVMTFIPYLGTIIALIPALLVALLSGPWTVVYVVLLYLGAHGLEGYVLSPLIQSRTVHLAPGWLILSQMVGGLAAGVFGILIAAPLLVTVTIMVQLLYVEDVLGDSVHVLGDEGADMHKED